MVATPTTQNAGAFQTSVTNFTSASIDVTGVANDGAVIVVFGFQDLSGPYPSALTSPAGLGLTWRIVWAPVTSGTVRWFCALAIGTKQPGDTGPTTGSFTCSIATSGANNLGYSVHKIASGVAVSAMATSAEGVDASASASSMAPTVSAAGANDLIFAAAVHRVAENITCEHTELNDYAHTAPDFHLATQYVVGNSDLSMGFSWATAQTCAAAAVVIPNAGGILKTYNAEAKLKKLANTRQAGAEAKLGTRISPWSVSGALLKLNGVTKAMAGMNVYGIVPYLGTGEDTMFAYIQTHMTAIATNWAAKGINVVRLLLMYDTSTTYKNTVKTFVDGCAAQGIYTLLAPYDVGTFGTWPGVANATATTAGTFLATLYTWCNASPWILMENFNEPNSAPGSANNTGDLTEAQWKSGCQTEIPLARASGYDGPFFCCPRGWAWSYPTAEGANLKAFDDQVVMECHRYATNDGVNYLGDHDPDTTVDSGGGFTQTWKAEWPDAAGAAGIAIVVGEFGPYNGGYGTGRSLATNTSGWCTTMKSTIVTANTAGHCAGAFPWVWAWSDGNTMIDKAAFDSTGAMNTASPWGTLAFGLIATLHGPTTTTKQSGAEAKLKKLAATRQAGATAGLKKLANTRQSGANVGIKALAKTRQSGAEVKLVPRVRQHGAEAQLRTATTVVLAARGEVRIIRPGTKQSGAEAKLVSRPNRTHGATVGIKQLGSSRISVAEVLKRASRVRLHGVTAGLMFPGAEADHAVDVIARKTSTPHAGAEAKLRFAAKPVAAGAEVRLKALASTRQGGATAVLLASKTRQSGAEAKLVVSARQHGAEARAVRRFVPQHGATAVLHGSGLTRGAFAEALKRATFTRQQGVTTGLKATNARQEGSTALLRASFTRQAGAAALLKATRAVQAGADADLHGTATRSHTASVKLLAQPTRAAGAQILAKALGLSRFTQAEVLKRASFTRAASADVKLSRVSTRTHGVETYMTGTVKRQAGAEVRLKALAIQRSAGAQALLRSSSTRQHSAQVIAQRKGVLASGAETRIRKLGALQHGAQVLAKRYGVLLAHGADARLQAHPIRQHGVTVILRASSTRGTFVEAQLKGTLARVHGAQVVGKKLGSTRQHGATVQLQSLHSGVHGVEVLLRRTTRPGHFAEVFLHLTVAKAHGATTLAVLRLSRVHGAAALLRSSSTRTGGAQALLVLRSTRQHGAEAILKASKTRQHGAQTYTIGRHLLAHGVDAKIYQPLTRAHGAEVVKRRTSTRAHGAEVLLAHVSWTTGNARLRLRSARAVFRTRP